MLFNVADPRAKARVQQSLLRRQVWVGRGFAKSLRAALDGAYDEAADLIEQQGVAVGLDVLLDQWLPDLFAAFRVGYKRAGASFYQLVADALPQVRGAHAPELKGMQEDFWNAFRGFVELNTARKVVGVGKVTKAWIRRRIDEGVRDGLSSREIAKTLRSGKSKQINKRRAYRIARTEVHMASNYATQQAVRATRLEMEKEWVAFVDERTREDHKVANGQRVPMGRDFRVGGEPMGYPGDPRGGAKNVVNCRCVLIYHTTRRGR